MSEAVEGERRVSEVSTGRRRLSRSQTIALFGVGTAALVGFVFWHSPQKKTDDDPVKTHQAGIGQTVSLVLPEIHEAPAAPLPTHLVQPPPPPPPQMWGNVSNMLPATPAKEEAHHRMLSYGGAMPVSAPAQGGAGSGAGADGGTTGGETKVAFKPATIPGGKAGLLADRTFMMMPGLIHCTLESAIDSTLPGPIMCHTSQDVLSPTGVTLMERGTTIMGEYKNDAHQGQERLFAMAGTAYTPKGVIVPLDGPMADGLGRAGMSADTVDNHNPQRFGGAVMLSLVSGAIGAGQAALSHGSNNTYLNFNSGGLQEAATEALRNSINIPPTITKNQGEDVTIWVRYPISFADVYRLEPRQ